MKQGILTPKEAYREFDSSRIYDDFKEECDHILERASSFQFMSPSEILIKTVDEECWLYERYNHKLISLPYNQDNMDSDTCAMLFGQRLKLLLYYKNIYKEELSRRTGISIATLNNYFKGDAMPNFYRLKQITRVLNCDTTDFDYDYD